MRKDALLNIDEIFEKDMGDLAFKTGVMNEYNKLTTSIKNKDM